MLLSLQWIKRTELGEKAWREENLPPGERWVLGKTKEEKKIVNLFEEWPNTNTGTFDRVVSVLIRRNWVEIVQNKEEKNVKDKVPKDFSFKGVSPEIGGKEALQALLARHMYENNDSDEKQRWVPKDHLEKENSGLVIIDKIPSSFSPIEKEDIDSFEDDVIFGINEEEWLSEEAKKQEEEIIKNEIEAAQLKQILLDPNKEKKLEDWVAFEDIFVPGKETVKQNKNSFFDANDVAFVSLSSWENSNEIDFLIDIFQNPSNIKVEEEKEKEKENVLLIKPTFEGLLEALNLSKEDIEKRMEEITEKDENEKENRKLISISLDGLLNSLDIDKSDWERKNEESTKEINQDLMAAFQRGGVTILKIALKNNGGFDETKLEKSNKDWLETSNGESNNNNNNKIIDGGVKDLASLLGGNALEYLNEIVLSEKESEKILEEMKNKNIALNNDSLKLKAFEFLQENLNIRTQREAAQKQREAFLIKKKQEEEEFKRRAEEYKKQEEERIKRIKDRSVDSLFARIKEKNKDKKD